MGQPDTSTKTGVCGVRELPPRKQAGGVGAPAQNITSVLILGSDHLCRGPADPTPFIFIFRDTRIPQLIQENPESFSKHFR